uniref:Serine-threonine/tyrosine-protein kinase catalytic domain-containing protein n=1 Tax=Panagrolaimus davidi TaxID=227884 RepID=A0A914Q1C7_9BILA
MSWEIFAGQEPYPGMTVAEVNGQVKQGYRMSFPEGTPMDMSTLIVRMCWTEDPNERASMADVSHALEKLTNLPRPPLVSTNPEPQTNVQTSRSKKSKAKKKSGK